MYSNKKLKTDKELYDYFEACSLMIKHANVKLLLTRATGTSIGIKFPHQSIKVS